MASDQNRRRRRRPGEDCESMKLKNLTPEDGFVKLRRAWLIKAKEYRTGTRWTCNDPDSKRMRLTKAKVLKYCADDVQHMLKHKEAF